MKNFNLLVHSIHDTHTTLQQSAVKTIDKHLTLRNWLIGFYIAEFEQNGEDRAKYGGKLLRKLAGSLGENTFSRRSLRLCRQFYLHYPQISRIIVSRLESLGIRMSPAWHSPIAKLLYVDSEVPAIEDPLIIEAKNASINYPIDPERLIDNLSYSHLVQLFPITSPGKRAFYESECIKRNWSVSELKQHINTLYFERSGLNVNPQKPSLYLAQTEGTSTSGLVKSPFIFEFLGLQSKDVVYENDAQHVLIDNLERFLIDLDNGFCLEAKRKPVTIDNECYFIDLVFYHRILKCHILIELKTNEGDHSESAQLATYLNYKKEIMPECDNPPVGLLLIADQDKAIVEYVVADGDMPLFVARYLDKLPTKEQWEMCLIKDNIV
jgi:predicted nuclease of restriction endonuclease-like (RecB) superfamily